MDLLGKSGLKPRDVEWIPVGADVSGRVAALQSGRVDATLLTAPAYFKVEEAEIQDAGESGRTSRYFRFYSVIDEAECEVAKADPKLPEKLLEAQAEATKRFYEDKAFAVKKLADLRQNGGSG